MTVQRRVRFPLSPNAWVSDDNSAIGIGALSQPLEICVLARTSVEADGVKNNYDEITRAAKRKTRWLSLIHI